MVVKQGISSTRGRSTIALKSFSGTTPTFGCSFGGCLGALGRRRNAGLGGRDHPSHSLGALDELDGDEGLQDQRSLFEPAGSEDDRGIPVVC